MDSDSLFIVSLLVVGYLIYLYFTLPCRAIRSSFSFPRHVDVAEWWGRGQIEWVDPMQCVYFLANRESGLN